MTENGGRSQIGGTPRGASALGAGRDSQNPVSLQVLFWEREPARFYMERNGQPWQVERLCPPQAEANAEGDAKYVSDVRAAGVRVLSV